MSLPYWNEMHIPSIRLFFSKRSHKGKGGGKKRVTKHTLKYEAYMTAKKSTKTGKNFRGGEGKNFCSWPRPEYIPLFCQVMSIWRSGHTSLHHACNAGHLQMVELLLQNGLNVNANDKKERRPLHYASHKVCLVPVQMLFRHEATATDNVVTLSVRCVNNFKFWNRLAI